MDISFSFLCGFRGYHKYRLVWNPTMLEQLLVRHEQDNTHDRYTIACVKKLPGNLHETVVGHFPKEISRFTYYILFRGARLSAKVVDTQHRRSPLVQGGLEIPIEVTLAMECSELNELYIKQYESLVKEKYKEPVEGQFEDATAHILQKINEEDDGELDSEDSDMEI